MQDDNSLSNLGSHSVALCCSFLVSSIPETIDALESVCETTSSNNLRKRQPSDLHLKWQARFSRIAMFALQDGFLRRSILMSPSSSVSSSDVLPANGSCDARR